MSLPISCHTDQFGTLGQIDPSHLAEIVKQGYKSVINNRPDFEGGPDQPTNAQIQAQAEALGLNYAFLPVIPGAFTQDQVIEMARLLKTMPGPILAFCRSGARSTNLYQMALQVRWFTFDCQREFMRIEIPEEKKFVHEMNMPIRWGDMDAYGHVNNTVYFRYMEQARVEWITSLGYNVAPGDESMLMMNGFCNFYQQLSYPGDLILKTYIGNIGRSSLDVFTTMALTTDPDRMAAVGGATMVWVDLKSGKSAPWPDDVISKLR